MAQPRVQRPYGVSGALRKKLSALAISPAAPSGAQTTPHDATSPTSPIFGANAKKRLFGWMKRATGPSENNEVDRSSSDLYRPPTSDVDDGDYVTLDDAYEVNDKIDEVMRKVICQAGVDYETRPMIVITASAMPDPREISYDVLLHRILLYLDLYVENDYTVVFLAAGGRNTPGWNWVWKAYRSLSRKYRKNLKRLFIVHSTWFSKMLFSLAGAIISPKFFRKIQYIPTLSMLAQYVPLTEIDIAPAVYQENLKHERQITLPVAHLSAVFGVSLNELMGEYGESSGMPRVVKDCVEYIRSYGLDVEGLFRRSPNSVLLRQVKEAYDRGHPVSLPTINDPHLAAVLLKKFFRDLPEPIFNDKIYSHIRYTPAPSDHAEPQDTTSVAYIRGVLIPELDKYNAPGAIVLSYVLHLLHDVSLHSAKNKMDAYNLSLVFSPNLVSSGNPVRDAQMCSIPSGLPSVSVPTSLTPTKGKTSLGSVIKLCIERYFEIFEEVPDRSEAVPTHGDADTSLSHSLDSLRAANDGPEEDDDMDASMLVMPLGPNSTSPPPPSAWTSPRFFNSPPVKSQVKRHKRTGSGGSVESAPNSPTPGPSRFNSTHNGSVGPAGTAKGGASRSLVSIEKAVNGSGGRGSITVGRGTTKRKGSGAGVEAVGVTALGFFTAPITDKKTGEEEPSKSRELSEVAE